MTERPFSFLKPTVLSYRVLFHPQGWAEMYDEVKACVEENQCSEKLEYVDIAADETRGTIHKAVTLVDESCKLRVGPVGSGIG